MALEYLLFSDLSALGSSPDSVKNKFKAIFGTEPDGLALNDETYYSGYQPPITQQYAMHCYKILGVPQFLASSPLESGEVIVGSNTAVNHSDQSAEIALMVVGAWTETMGWNLSVTTGMQFKTEFKVEGIFSTGWEFSLNVSGGKSGSTGTRKSSQATATVQVPAKSKITINMIATMKKVKLDFKAPIKVSGSFGANFPEPVRGHYFWFVDAEQLLPMTQAEITGVITGAAAFDIRTEIGEIESI
ncbi:hypothetical protein [Enterobacter sp. 22466]|uniref:hypothetical protein n=1 Tax=Enterobacter sp. 22466 TaxID=3453924 RepID=UPI003F85B102